MLLSNGVALRAEVVEAGELLVVGGVEVGNEVGVGMGRVAPDGVGLVRVGLAAMDLKSRRG